MKKRSIFSIIIISIVITACSNPLKEQTYSTLSSSNFYKSEQDAEALLNGVYAVSQGYRDFLRDVVTITDMPGGIMLEKGGSVHSFIGPIENFTWSATSGTFSFLWNRYYKAIYRANNFLDKVSSMDINKNEKREMLAEARFLRVFNYFRLYNMFGPTPLITDSDTKASDRPKRATKKDMINFIEGQFKEASQDLPLKPKELGRASKGAALGLLCKFYLNNHKWEDAASTCKEVMDEGVYSLYIKDSRTDLFGYDNTHNSEFIFVIPFHSPPKPGLGDSYLSHAAPPGYKYKHPPKVVFAAQISVYSSFIDTFNPNDERIGAFLFQYVNQSGQTIHLGHNDVRDFKFGEDPQGVGDVNGITFPVLRYADILLSRAEALNEINGPNQASIDLINKVRSAAGLKPIMIGEYPTKIDLRDYILKARGWEFHSEGLRRQDLIRMGKFIQYAKNRGLPAKKYQVLYPIPQTALDRNSNLEQNPGYN